MVGTGISPVGEAPGAGSQEPGAWGESDVSFRAYDLSFFHGEDFLILCLSPLLCHMQLLILLLSAS